MLWICLQLGRNWWKRCQTDDKSIRRRLLDPQNDQSFLRQSPSINILGHQHGARERAWLVMFGVGPCPFGNLWSMRDFRIQQEGNIANNWKNKQKPIWKIWEQVIVSTSAKKNFKRPTMRIHKTRKQPMKKSTFECHYFFPGQWPFAKIRDPSSLPQMTRTNHHGII